MATAQEIMRHLGDLGYSQAQAAAIAGHMKTESGYDPKSYNTGEGAYGLMQWRGPRLKALEEFTAARGGSIEDPRTQMEFMRSEMLGSEAKNTKGFYAAPDDVNAASAALKPYIRYGSDTDAVRLQNAQELMRPVADQTATPGAAMDIKPAAAQPAAATPPQKDSGGDQMAMALSSALAAPKQQDAPFQFSPNAPAIPQQSLAQVLAAIQKKRAPYSMGGGGGGMM